MRSAFSAERNRVVPALLGFLVCQEFSQLAERGVASKLLYLAISD